MEIPKFKYNPINLSKIEIRLIDVLPCREGCNDISLKLRHHTFKSHCFPPHYLSLPYTWETPYDGLSQEYSNLDFKVLIHLNEQSFEIGLNLAAFLKHFSHYIKVPTTIWIDAICINQRTMQKRLTRLD